MKTKPNNYADYLVLAAELGDHEAIENFLKIEGADINAFNRKFITPLIAAVDTDRKETMKFLLKNGASLIAPSCTHSEALNSACCLDDDEMVDILLAVEGVDINNSAYNTGETPLLSAVLHGKLNTINKLIEKGASVNASNSHGLTPLMIAARGGHKDVVIRLLEVEGIDATAVDTQIRSPQTASQYARQSGYPELEIAQIIEDFIANQNKTASE